MQVCNSLSSSPDKPLACLMAMLDLDLRAIERGGELFGSIKRRCTICDLRERCEMALRRARLDIALSGACPPANDRQV